MTTIINTPSVAKESKEGSGLMIGLVIFIVAAYLFFTFGLSAMRRIQWGTPQVNIPSKIDVNINQPNQ